MKKFTLFWLTGEAEIVEGIDIANAFNKAGYGAGALQALDFYSEGDTRKEYLWDKKARIWNKVTL